MAIYDILPTTLRDRFRIWLNRSPVTPIINWDTLSPVDLPQPDTDAVRQMIVERVAAHASADSLDDAYGDLLDRLIRPTCRRWSDQTGLAYEEQLRVWAFLEEQGTQHSLALGQQLARLNIELARHQVIEDQVWADLMGSNSSSLPTAAKLAVTDPLPPPPVPTAQLPYPYRPLPITSTRNDSNGDGDGGEPGTPLIHSV